MRGHEYGNCGSLRDGKMVWGLAKVKESFSVGKEDQVDSYLLFANPHEYGKSIDIRFTPIRVVCNNTLSMALASVKNQVQNLTIEKYLTQTTSKRLWVLQVRSSHSTKKLRSFLRVRSLVQSNH